MVTLFHRWSKNICSFEWTKQNKEILQKKTRRVWLPRRTIHDARKKFIYHTRELKYKFFFSQTQNWKFITHEF